MRVGGGGGWDRGKSWQENEDNCTWTTIKKKKGHNLFGLHFPGKLNEGMGPSQFFILGGYRIYEESNGPFFKWHAHMCCILCPQFQGVHGIKDIIIIPSILILYCRWASPPQTWTLHRAEVWQPPIHTFKEIAGRFFGLKKKAKWQDVMGNVFPISILFFCRPNDNHQGSSLGSVAFP